MPEHQEAAPFFSGSWPVFSNSCMRTSARLSFPFGLFRIVAYIGNHGSLLLSQRAVLSFASFVDRVLSFRLYSGYLLPSPYMVPRHAAQLPSHAPCLLYTVKDMDIVHRYSRSFYIPGTPHGSLYSTPAFCYSGIYSSRSIHRIHTHTF